MNARGIPAQSEPDNLEKEYSYTVNEMTGEHIPFGQKAKHPQETSPPTGDQQSAAKGTDQHKEESQRRQQPRREKSE